MTYARKVVFFVAAACLLGEELFITGGMGEHEVYNYAESYETETGLWEPISRRMLEARVGLGEDMFFL